MGREEDRDAACDAYEALLDTLVEGGPRALAGFSQGRVRRIGTDAGFTGEVREWDWMRARDELDRLARLVRRGPVRLDCHCRPLRCHACAIGRLLAGS